MEKLIVKNFGPIKEAEIDLTKYVVFIGDTSTGKSVLAKLIAIFRDNDIYLSSHRVEEFDKLLNHYNINFKRVDTYIEYSLKDISMIFTNNSFKVSERIKDKIPNITNDIDTIKKADLAELMNKIHSAKSLEDLKVLRSLVEKFVEVDSKIAYIFPVYIPAERILNSLVSSSLSGLWANNVALPPYFKDFSAKFEVARKQISSEIYHDIDIAYSIENGIDYIMYEGEKIKLSQSSSGMQSIIPLIHVLNYEINYNSYKLIKNILIEEPELNLFPIKQKSIIEYIISLFYKSKQNKLIITTHSPYILSVLDTLMLAKNTYNEHPDLKEEIAAIVSEDKWIDYDDISVYEVKNDGTIRSIKNAEFKSIDTNAIDGVSDIISEQFDKLTELRYAQ